MIVVSVGMNRSPPGPGWELIDELDAHGTVPLGQDERSQVMDGRRIHRIRAVGRALVELDVAALVGGRSECIFSVYSCRRRSRSNPIPER